MLTPDSIATPTSTKTLIGSTMIMEAESLEKMTEIIHSDIYYTAGVVRFFCLPTPLHHICSTFVRADLFLFYFYFVGFDVVGP